MLRQQMRSCDRKIETVVVHSTTEPLRDEFSQLNYSRNFGVSLNCLNPSPTAISSIAITNNNFHPISPLQSEIADSTLPTQLKPTTQHTLHVDSFRLRQLKPTAQHYLHVDSLRFPFQRSSVEPSLCARGIQRPTMLWDDSYFENFSQSNACIAFRFGECRTYTVLDQLWYFYSYIYKPTTTICYGIYIFLNSRHTGLLRLLPGVKHTTTTSASLPLLPPHSFTTSSSTTHSTLQLSILLESTSAPSLSITSGPFFVNFIKSIIFLYLAGVDNEDNDPESPTRPDIRYEFDSLHVSPFRLLTILKPTTPSIAMPLCTTRSTLHLFAFLESTVSSFPLFSRPLFVTFFLSPAGTVTLLRLELSFGTNLLRSNLFLSPVVDGDTFGRTGTTTHTKQSRRGLDLCFDTVFVGRTLFYGRNDSSYYHTGTTVLRPVYQRQPITTILQSKRLKLLSNSTCTVSVINILRSRRFKLLSSVIAIIIAIATTVSDNIAYATAAISISLINSPLHIIDHGSLVYLIHLQIRFYDQQDSLSWLENNNGECDMNNTDEMTRGVMGIATSYNSSADAISATKMTTSMQVYPSSLHYDNNILDAYCQSSDNNNDGGNDKYITVTSGVTMKIISYELYVAAHSVVTESSFAIIAVFHKIPSTVHNGIMTTAVTQTIISYGTGKNDIDLYIDTVFDARSSVSNDNDSDSFGRILLAFSVVTINTTFDTTFDTTSSSVVQAIAATIFVQESSAGNDYPATVTMTTQVYSSSPSPSQLSNKHVTFSTVANAVASTTTSYVSPSSYNNNNNNDGCNDESHSTLRDGIFSTTKTTTSSSFESSNNDETFSAVADAVTRTTLPHTSPSSEQLLLLSYNTMSSTVRAIAAVTSEIYDLHFDTVIAIIVAVAPAVAVGAPSVVKTKTYATIFITLLCSHIIDQGSVLYLIQQTLLYNQQYVFSCAALTTNMTCNTAVLVITKISSAIYDEDSSTGNDSPVTIMVATQVDSSRSSSSSYNDRYTDGANDNVMPSSTDDEATSVPVPVPAAEMPFAVTDGISSAAIADGAQYDYYYGDTAVSIASPSIVSNDESHSTVHDRIYSTMKMTAFHELPSTIHDGIISAGNDSTATVTTTAPVYDTVYNANFNFTFDTIPIAVTTKTYNMPSAIHDGIISADNNAVSSAAVTIMTTAVKIMKNVMNTAVYFAVIDAESSTDITNTITLYESPSYDIDTESSAVSVADEATTTDSCHSSNYFSLISSRQFDQITSVLSTLMSLHRTLHLIFNFTTIFDSMNWVGSYFDF